MANSDTNEDEVPGSVNRWHKSHFSTRRSGKSAGGGAGEVVSGLGGCLCAGEGQEKGDAHGEVYADHWIAG